MIDIITMLVTFAVVAYFNTRISRNIAPKIGHTAKSVPELSNISTITVKDIEELKIEQHHDTYYFFLQSNDTFMGQGKTLDLAARHFALLRGTDILGWFNLDNKKYCFINNECLPFEKVN